MSNTVSTTYLVQQRYQTSWVTEDVCATLEHAKHEASEYRRVNNGRTLVRIVKR